MNEDGIRLWGGRFRKAPSEALMRLSGGTVAHLRLVPHDLAGSFAHARRLLLAGVLSADEHAAIERGLAELGSAVTAGDAEPTETDEDIHTFLERELIARIGPVGARLRAGRSRNDQAANDLKRYLRTEVFALAEALTAMARALAGRAEAEAATLCPGFTHLQIAQPVTFGHVLMAHAQPLARDLERLRDWRLRSGECPLGAAALAGSGFPGGEAEAARALGYDAPFENAIDAVAARDHVAEFLFVLAMIGTNLSRLAEDITLWTSRQFGWAGLDDAFATGSSIMPQKKNPDIAEIARGRAPRLVGNLVAMLGVLKGLPLAYNRDLAEDKRAAFDSLDALLPVLPALTGLIETLVFDRKRMARDASDGFALATEPADYLARKGASFAEAHAAAGAMVRLADSRGVGLDALDADDLAAIDPRLGPEMRLGLTPAAAVAARNGSGGTAPERVREQITRFRRRIEETHRHFLSLQTGASL